LSNWRKPGIIALVSLNDLFWSHEVDPTKDIKNWNRARIAYAQGTQENGQFMSNPAIKGMFLADKGLKVGLGLIQKLVFNTNGPIKLNARLPKGVNF